MSGGLLIFAVGGLLAAAVGASLVAERLRMPALLLFLAVGMAAGSDGAGWISFADYGLARELGVAALALILFNGGLNTSFTEIRPSLGAAVRLACGATVIVAVLTGIAAALLLGLGLLQGLLLGSILASTDSAAVFGLLRSSTLRRSLVRTMEAESGFNDAVVLVLVLGFIRWINEPSQSIADLAMLAARQLAVGAICGFVVAKAAGAAIHRIRLPRTGLYAVASGIPGGDTMFDVVVVAVIVSTLIQGLSFESLARALGLTRVVPLLPRPFAEFGGAARLGAEMVEYTVVSTDGTVGHRVRD